MSTDFLNLSYYKTIEVRENAYDYLVYAETTLKPKACPKCDHLDFVHYGLREPVIMDIPSHGKRVGIKVQRHRYQCKHCKAVFIDPMPGIDENRRMTTRLMRFIQQEALKRTFTSISEDVGVTEGAVRDVFRKYTADMESKFNIEIPTWMGIDEIHIIGKPRCVIVNVKDQALVDMLRTRNKPVVEGWLMNLKEERHKIEIVTMDMWNPYREAVENCLPGARIIIDRFHVVKYANKSLEDYRKALKAGMKPNQRRQLMHDRFILLRRARDLTENERMLLDTWTGNLPKLGKAYALKEAFFDLYDLPDRKAAEDQYGLWCETVAKDNELIDYFSPMIQMVNNWYGPIFNYFDQPITNAYAESINSLIKLTNRTGRGYSFEAIRAKMLFKAARIYRGKPKFDRKGDETMGMIDLHQPGDEGKPLSPGVHIPTLLATIDEDH